MTTIEIVIIVISGITILALLIMLGLEVKAECNYKDALTTKIINETYERKYKRK